MAKNPSSSKAHGAKGTTGTNPKSEPREGVHSAAAGGGVPGGASARASEVEVLEIPLTLLLPPTDLARPVDQGEYYAGIMDSLRAMGQIDPIIVQTEGRFYRIVDGMHRFIAAQEMGWSSLRAQVFDDNPASIEAIQLHANQVHREMTAWEEYKFFTMLLTKCKLDFEGLCRHVRRSESYVSTRLLIDKLTPETQKALETDQITLSLAEQLMRVKDPVWERYWLELCLKSGTGAKVLRGWITQWQLNQATPSPQQVADALTPPPAPPAVPEMVCALCAQHGGGRLMLNVWVHNDELQQVAAVIQGVDARRAVTSTQDAPIAGQEGKG